MTAAISRCQAAAGTSISTLAPIDSTTVAALRRKAIRPLGGHHGWWSRKSRRTALPANTPMPYPMAALIPPITPASTQSRGTSDGVRDRQKNSAPTATPTKSSRTRLHVHSISDSRRRCVPVGD